MAHLERAVTASGFHDPANPKRLMPRMRRCSTGCGLEKEEVAILRGMLTTFETVRECGGGSDRLVSCSGPCLGRRRIV
jgi:tRNA/rRNA methyltransferase